jgi:hypothetical protein
MSRRLSFAFLSAIFVYALSLVVASPARAVNCDLNACMNTCNKRATTPGSGCTSWCLQAMEERKAKGQCKK